MQGAIWTNGFTHTGFVGRVAEPSRWWGAVNLSVHSNPIVNNIGPENTNRCDAAAAIEGCSEVSEPNSLQTDTLVNTKEETTGAEKGPNYKGSWSLNL